MDGTDAIGPQRALDRDAFRDVIGRFATGVTVLTATHDGADHGMTASAVSSLSLEPPMLLACVNRATATHDAIAGAGAFVVNILDETQAELAERFGGRRPDKFAGVAIGRGAGGAPVLRDALACIECRVTEAVHGTTHGVFMAIAEAAEVRDGAPLTYFRGTFGRFASPGGEAVYQELRLRVLRRDVPVGAAIEIDVLSDELGVPRHEVHTALVRLAGDGLVARVRAGGHVVAPVDRAALEQALGARRALETGAADVAVGSAAPEQLAELRRRADETARWVCGGRFVDQDAYLRANDAFHEHVVAMAANPLLLGMYRRIGAEAVMGRATTGRDHADEALVEDHNALVEAFERRDLAAAKAVIVRHVDLARAIGVAALEDAGGSL